MTGSVLFCDYESRCAVVRLFGGHYCVISFRGPLTLNFGDEVRGDFRSKTSTPCCDTALNSLGEADVIGIYRTLYEAREAAIESPPILSIAS